MNALIVGASGLIGNHLLKKLISSSNYASVISVGRKNLDIQHPKLKQFILELADLKNNAELLKADDYFCCLGTTIKIAKTKENFKKVDFDAPLALAEIAKKYSATGFYIVSSLGADTKSRVFYSQVKGQLESELKKLNLSRLVIFQPSLLLGERKEFRLGEKLFENIRFFPLWIGPLKRYRPIQAERVAESMIRASQNKSFGIEIITSDQMQS